MFDSGIFAESSADRIHRDNIFRIIVFYCGKITEFPPDSILGGEQICYLNINPLFCFCGYEVYLSNAENADCYLETLTAKMIPHNIFHDFLYTFADIISAKIIANTMVREIMLIVRLKKHLAMYIEPLDWNSKKCVTEILQVI